MLSSLLLTSIQMSVRRRADLSSHDGRLGHLLPSVIMDTAFVTHALVFLGLQLLGFG